MAATVVLLSTALGWSATQSASASSSTGTITVAYGSTYVFDTTQLTTRFLDQPTKPVRRPKPGTQLQLVPIPGSYNDIINKLSLLYCSGNPPDLAELPTAQRLQYLQRKWR